MERKRERELQSISVMPVCARRKMTNSGISVCTVREVQGWSCEQRLPATISNKKVLEIEHDHLTVCLLLQPILLTSQ